MAILLQQKETELAARYASERHGSDFEVYTSYLTPAYLADGTKQFNPLFAGALPAPPETTIYMVGSSTVQDLHGDTMEESALVDMTAVHPHLSIFMNHDYELPGKLYGSLLCQPMMTRSGTIVDLHLAADTETTNEDAMRTFIYIQKGRRIGVSGGFKVLEWTVEEGYDEFDWFAPLHIHHVDTVEFSTVGVPANQRSWVTNAAEGLFLRSIVEDRGEDALRLAPIVKSLFPRDYRGILKDMQGRGLRLELEQVTPRRSPTEAKLLWTPMTRSFVLTSTSGLVPIERGAVADLVATLIPKTASGKTSWPIMDLGTEWTGSVAEQQIFAWASGEDEEIQGGKAKQCFLYSDPAHADTKQGYKMPFCYVGDGSPRIVPLGVRACANVLAGGMGGVGASDADKAGMKSKVKTMYGRINATFAPDPAWVVPWENGEEDKGMENEEQAAVPLAELVLKADGSHAKTTGTHTHDHPAYGGDTNADGDHSHEHTHDGDNSHQHAHDDQEDEPADQEEPDDKEPKDPGKKGITGVHDALWEVKFGVLCALSRELGLPEPDGTGFEVMTKAAVHEKMKKAGQQLHQMATDLHPEACPYGDAGSDGEENGGGQKKEIEGRGTAGRAQGQSVPETEAQAEAQRATLSATRSAQEAMTLFTEVLPVLKSLREAETVVADMERLKAGIHRIQSASTEMSENFTAITRKQEDLFREVEALSQMPLKRPTQMQRQVQEDTSAIASASYEDLRTLARARLASGASAYPSDLSVKEALQVVPLQEETRTYPGTQIAYTLSFREWPEGLIPEGGRPALSGDQIAQMKPYQVLAYEQGRAARVPVLD